MSGIAARFGELGKLPTLCVLNWNAVSLSNSEPLDGVSKISLFVYLNFKWRASLVPAAFGQLVAEARLMVYLPFSRKKVFRFIILIYDLHFL